MAEPDTQMKNSILKSISQLHLTPSLKMIGVLFLTVLLSLAIRLGWISHEQLDMAQSAIEQNQTDRAIIYYQRSIQAYLPWLPAREKAKSEMISLLKTLENRSDETMALEGWRRLRGALLSTRTIFGQPDHALLTKANRNIARLAATTDTQKLMSPEEIEQESLQLLTEYPKDIVPFWGVMQFLFLILWIGSSCWLIWFWQESDTKFRITFTAVSIGAWILWLTSLSLAA